ncbi:MAG: hypothetical protein JO134_20315, partial [Xanthobacteraceae bacterium]|nr:hypothetical protein [Xanthobacteraceae bacterium]
MTSEVQAAPPVPVAKSVGQRLGITGREWRNLVIVAVLFVAAGFVPLVGSGYVLSIAISIAIYTALATSWMLFSGPTNYI